jgi:hypothetical protein
MLTLLMIPRSLKHVRIINTLDSRACDALVGIIPSIIGRNSCTLTSIELSFHKEWLRQDHEYEMGSFSIGLCSLLTTLKLGDESLTKDQASLRMLVKRCPRLQIIPKLSCEVADSLRTLTILGNLSL